MLPVPTNTAEIIMFEIAERVEVKTNQYCDDFGIGHHPLSTSFWSVRRGVKDVFCHLHFKFFAKIIGNTENFSNFTFGYHDTVFLLFVTSKLLNITDITKRIGNFFKLPIQLF